MRFKYLWLCFFASKICDALRDLVRFVQFKKRENPLKSVAFKPATLLKVVLLNGCFSRFVNDANVTKLSKTSHIVFLGKIRETSNELWDCWFERKIQLPNVFSSNSIKNIFHQMCLKIFVKSPNNSLICYGKCLTYCFVIIR